MVDEEEPFSGDPETSLHEFYDESEVLRTLRERRSKRASSHLMPTKISGDASSLVEDTEVADDLL